MGSRLRGNDGGVLMLLSTDSWRDTSRPWVSPLAGASHFSLCAQREVTKRNAPGRPARCAGALRFSDLSGVHRQAIPGLTMDARHPCLRPAPPAFSNKSCDARPATRDLSQSDAADPQIPVGAADAHRILRIRALACLSPRSGRVQGTPRNPSTAGQLARSANRHLL